MESAKKHTIGNMKMTPREDEVSFLCLNFSETYETGTLKLPPMFADIYGEKIPPRVYIHLPNGAVWIGTYSKSNQRIEGIKTVMNYYEVKPYHVVTLVYSGSSDFLIQIFNTYAVEMNYPFELKPYQISRATRQSQGLLRDNLLNTSEFEKDRLFSTLRYNAFTGGIVQHDLKISKIHLQKKSFIQVFTHATCSELGINRSMHWIELGFRKYMWHITLKWHKDNVLFNSDWFKFAKAGGLHEGDLCVFQSTPHPQRFEVAIFEKERHDLRNKTAYEEGKGLLKWFKVLDDSTVNTGELELPRLFVELFGHELSEEVRFFLPDGTQYGGFYCSAQNAFYCFRNMFAKYSVAEYFVLFFDYVGQSSFYVSIYNTYGMDIFNDLGEKLLVKEVIHNLKTKVVILSDSTSQNSANNSVREEARSIQLSGSTLNLYHFTVSMKVSHVDQNGHGVYLPRHLLPLYRTWKNATAVTLVCAKREWKVAVHRKGKMCRFGRGWDQFTLHNQVALGQKMDFTYVHDYTFQVTVSN